MKEIKFRAYHKPSKLLLQVVQLDLNLGSSDRGHTFYDPNTGYYRLAVKDCEIIEFTGLKDKNGKEIYEGDILNILYQEDNDWKDVSWEDNYVVEFSQAGFKVRNVEDYKEKILSIGYLGEKYPDEYTFKILGNIYENKELLNANS